MNTTDRFRLIARWLWAVCIVAGLMGWAIWGRDPAKLETLLIYTTIGAGVGEFANVGKRATFKREAVEDA